ncbi:MAG: Gfo/Idh/MocA family oxidoreductase [Planctomycetota bacterium]
MNDTTCTTRRTLLTTAALASAAGVSAGLLGGCASAGATARQPAVSGCLRGAPPIGHVRFGVIGVGDRGSTLLRLINLMPDADAVAIADPYKPAAQRARTACHDAGKPKPTLYTDGDHDYRKLLERDDLDAVIIATPWRWHAPQGLEAMRAGKHAFIEVPLALTIDEMWSLVETSESTGMHCMMLENVNYGRDELMTLNLCRQGVFGELIHAEASYIHDLRSQMHHVDWGTGSWRTAYHATAQGNLYPTHGLGPVAQYMNLDRADDAFGSLTSMSSPAIGRNIYAETELPEGHPHRVMHYTCGDINSTLIRTRLGRTILVQYDTTSPRPYTRHNLIQGTGGCLAGFPTRVAVEAWGDYHDWIEGDALEEIRSKYEHPLWTRLGAEAEAAGGHGGMDYLMLRRVVENLRKGTPMDQTVYEGASWSVVRPLSEASARAGGKSIDFPDFSRGRYREITPLEIVS